MKREARKELDDLRSKVFSAGGVTSLRRGESRGRSTNNNRSNKEQRKRNMKNIGNPDVKDSNDNDDGDDNTDDDEETSSKIPVNSGNGADWINKAFERQKKTTQKIKKKKNKSAKDNAAAATTTTLKERQRPWKQTKTQPRERSTRVDPPSQPDRYPEDEKSFSHIGNPSKNRARSPRASATNSRVPRAPPSEHHRQQGTSVGGQYQSDKNNKNMNSYTSKGNKVPLRKAADLKSMMKNLGKPAWNNTRNESKREESWEQKYDKAYFERQYKIRGIDAPRSRSPRPEDQDSTTATTPREDKQQQKQQRQEQEQEQEQKQREEEKQKVKFEMPGDREKRVRNNR